MRLFLALALLLACGAGCRAITAAGDVARQYDEIKPQIEAAIEAGKATVELGKQTLEEVKEIKAVEAKARAEADKDGDGLDPKEYMDYVSLLALGMAEYLRRKTNAVQKQTDELYDATHRPVQPTK